MKDFFGKLGLIVGIIALILTLINIFYLQKQWKNAVFAKAINLSDNIIQIFDAIEGTTSVLNKAYNFNESEKLLLKELTSRAQSLKSVGQDMVDVIKGEKVRKQ